MALSKGFEVAGTLGILALASRRRLIQLDDAFTQLKRTNFRFRQEMMDELLERDKDLRSQEPSREQYGNTQTVPRVCSRRSRPVIMYQGANVCRRC